MARNETLFLVEDHPTTGRALKMYLETHGYTVILASDMASALKLAAESPFDLLICDISLPDGTGWDLMKTLSSKRPIRGIAFTASGSEEDVAKSERVGFLKHVVKGCAAEELAAIIQETLKLKPKSKAPSVRLNKKTKSAKSS